jgi:hypothetical protein
MERKTHPFVKKLNKRHWMERKTHPFVKKLNKRHGTKTHPLQKKTSSTSQFVAVRRNKKE